MALSFEMMIQQRSTHLRTSSFSMPSHRKHLHQSRQSFKLVLIKLQISQKLKRPWWSQALRPLSILFSQTTCLHLPFSNQCSLSTLPHRLLESLDRPRNPALWPVLFPLDIKPDQSSPCVISANLTASPMGYSRNLIKMLSQAHTHFATWTNRIFRPWTSNPGRSLISKTQSKNGPSRSVNLLHVFYATFII